MTSASIAHRTLRGLGFTPAICDSIVGEVCRHFLDMRDFYGATEDQDLWAIAVATTWETARAMPEARGGLLRLHVRWAVRDAIKKEAHAHGVYISTHRTCKTSRDAAQWPDCACGQPVGARQAHLCPGCRRDRLRLRNTARKRRWRQFRAAA